MFETIKNAWKVADLRKKILYTIFVILIFRIGSAIVVPFISADVLSQMFANVTAGGTIFSYLDMMSGGGLSQATIFSLSITPYINASIIIQLLTIGIPALERIAKQPDGQKKLATITRYTTVGISLLMSFAYYMGLRNGVNGQSALTDTGIFPAIIIMLSFTAGSTFLMWLGEQVNEKGIGNGISIILFAGIVSRGPALIGPLIIPAGTNGATWWMPALLVSGMLAMVVFLVIMTGGERRIPVQYAKRVVGRKMYGGQASHIPIKVNMTGVLPIIFAQSLISLPATIALAFPNPDAGTFWAGFLDLFSYRSWFYAVLYFLLIIFFNYFYTTFQFNPVEIGNNIKKNGGFIPGIRPGKPTSDFITKVLSKITMLGALFLAVIALAPILIGYTGLSVQIGGTSLLILVGVAIETYKQIESQLLMRHYKGFLD